MACDVFRCAGQSSTPLLSVGQAMGLGIVLASLMTLPARTVIAQTDTDAEITDSNGVNAAFLEFLGLVSELDEVGLTTDVPEDSEQGTTGQTLD